MPETTDIQKIEKIQTNVLRKAESQEKWRLEVIEKAIDVLCGATHRDRDIACKHLLQSLKNMPTIQHWDIDIPSEGLPF
jgi:hypothetical protein